MRTIYEMHDPVRSAKNEIFLRNYLGTHIGLHPGARDLSTGKHKKHNAPIWRHYGDVANLKVETCLSNWSMAIPALIGKPKSTDKAGRVSKATGLNSFLYPGGKPLDSVKVTAAVLPHELTSLDYGKVVIDKVYQAMPGQDQRLFTSLMPSFECSPAQFVARLPGNVDAGRWCMHYCLTSPLRNLQGSYMHLGIVKTTPLPKDGLCLDSCGHLSHSFPYLLPQSSQASSAFDRTGQSHVPIAGHPEIADFAVLATSTES